MSRMMLNEIQDPKPVKAESSSNCEIPFKKSRNDNVSSLIPNEIWVKILSHLNQKDLVRTRGVCHGMRNIIDEHFQFSVIIHDDKTDLRRVYELKIRDFLVTKLMEDVDILQYPDLLKRIRFWGPINVLNLHRMLFQATKLEELSLTRCALIQNNLMPEENVRFDKLIKLELLGYCCKDADEVVSINTVRLLSHEMPSLRKIFVNITSHWMEMDQILVAFLKLISQHRKKITHVNASLIPASSSSHETISNMQTIIPEDVKNAIYDEILQLESLRVTLASKYIPCWAPIIANQRKLADLRVHWANSSELTHVGLTGIPCTILYPAITQSAATLVSVDLRELNLTIDDDRRLIPFDASIFCTAQNLRRLVLVRNKDDCQRHVEMYGDATMTNINLDLPFLEELEIVRFKCLSSELHTIIDSTIRLTNVKLHHTGVSDRKGVHGGIVESIIKKPAIKIINICPINYFEPEENKKLDAVKSRYAGICSTSDHVYYNFDKKGISPTTNSTSVISEPTRTVSPIFFPYDRPGFNSYRVQLITAGSSQQGSAQLCIVDDPKAYVPDQIMKQQKNKNYMRNFSLGTNHRVRHRSQSTDADIVRSNAGQLACAGNLRPRKRSSSCTNRKLSY